jgi:hypothetical protein
MLPVMASASAWASRMRRTHSAAPRLPVERNFSAAAMASAETPRYFSWAALYLASSLGSIFECWASV